MNPESTIFHTLRSAAKGEPVRLTRRDLRALHEPSALRTLLRLQTEFRAVERSLQEALAHLEQVTKRHNGQVTDQR